MLHRLRDDFYYGCKADGTVRLVQFVPLLAPLSPDIDDARFENVLMDISITPQEWVEMLSRCAVQDSPMARTVAGVLHEGAPWPSDMSLFTSKWEAWKGLPRGEVFVLPGTPPREKK